MTCENWEYATAVVHNQFWCGFISSVHNDSIVCATPTLKNSVGLELNEGKS